MKALVGAFNQEKALVGAFSVITNLRMELFEALISIVNRGGHLAAGGGDGDPGEVDGAAAPGPAPVAGGVAQRADGGAPRLPGRVLPRVLVMHTP